jgi:hypothetical protein
MLTLRAMNDAALHTDPQPTEALPTALTPLDHLRLQLAHERQKRAAVEHQVLALQLAAKKREHDDLAAATLALENEARATYALTGNATVDLATGAITRG